MLQTGGSDQWGNLTSGVDLIHRVEGASVHAIGTPLITNSDGTKFGKSEGNAIWLDPEMCSPYRMYQFWLNTDDADVISRLKVFTFLTRAQIEELEQLVATEPFRRAAQKRLAFEITTFVHGPDAAAAVIAASEALFGQGDLTALDPVTLRHALDELPNAEVAAGTTVVQALVDTGLVSSLSEGPPCDRAGRRLAGRRPRRRRVGGRVRFAARRGVGAAPRQEDARGRVRRPVAERPGPSERPARMPFTPSHAVVALPFVRTPLVPAAIAVGAMAPDLPLFVRFSPLGYGRTHDLAWLPATVLLALALLLAWRCVLRPAARELSPRWLAGRLPAEWDRGAAGSLRDTLGVRTVRAPGRPQRRSVSWRAVALLVVSLALGVVSHIAWDLFTHEGRGGVDLFPALAEQWGPLAGYKWLQHGSSVVGLAISRCGRSCGCGDGGSRHPFRACCPRGCGGPGGCRSR